MTKRHKRSDPPWATAKATLDEIRWFKRYHIEATFCGVYFLFDGDECVYVGKSGNVHARVQQHKTQGLKGFESYTWMPAEPDDVGYWELHYIEKINPRLNQSGRVLQKSYGVENRSAKLLETAPKSFRSVQSIMGATDKR